MSFIDIVFAVFLCFALYKGIKNGLFIELASLLALVLGIFAAIKFSYFIKSFLEEKVDWEHQYIEIAAFTLTFLLVVLLVHLLAKLLTKVASFAFVGWLNKLAGGVFSVLKTLLFLSVIILIFEKINSHTTLVKQETLNGSIFYNPTKECAGYIFPKIRTWYYDLNSENNGF